MGVSLVSFMFGCMAWMQSKSLAPCGEIWTTDVVLLQIKGIMTSCFASKLPSLQAKGVPKARPLMGG